VPQKLDEVIVGTQLVDFWREFEPMPPVTVLRKRPFKPFERLASLAQACMDKSYAIGRYINFPSTGSQN
jgi:hypothetical protein